MGVATEKYIRKPLYVDAIRVTSQNFDEIAEWCQGEVQTEESPDQGIIKKYIRVRVHNPKVPRQTKAFVGDWILYTERGYKVYTNRAFHLAFDAVTEPDQNGGNGGQTIQNAHFHSVSAVAEEPSQESGVQPILEVSEEKGEPKEPGLQTAALAGGHPIDPEEPIPGEDAPKPGDTPIPGETAQRILTEAEQREMDPEEVRELLRSGEAVLAQDLVR